MARIAEITYIDNRHDEIEVTLFDTVQAERHLQTKHMTSAEVPSTFASYVAYVALRRAGKTDGKTYEEWAQTVSNLIARDDSADDEQADDPLV